MKCVKRLKCLMILLAIWSLSTSSFAAEWQWSVEIKSVISGETNDHPRAFLWIPSDCKQVRGVVAGMHNMLEEGIFEHPQFRKTLSEIGFAEIWVTPGLDPLFDVTKGSQESFDEMLNSLADVSGYTELKFAPVVPIGHSALASYPWNFAAWNPQRTLAMLSVHGDAPLTNLTGCGRPNLDWGNRTIEGIPGLMVMGEYEWWENRLSPAIAYKNKYPKAPISLLADAGHGHFDYSDNLVAYLAMFIKKVAAIRLPATMPMDKPATLISVDPSKGWLADRWRKDSIPQAKAAPYNQYKGNKAKTFWYQDKEMADATEKYYAQARGKKEQYIGFMQNNVLLSFNPNLHARINARFVPGQDGLTFHVSAAFTDTLREKTIAEHAAGKANITRICGPVEKVNDSTFTVRFYRMGLNNLKRTGDIWLIAANDGDKEYKSTVQQLDIRIPHRNTEGVKQCITFAPIQNVGRKAKSVSLHATSDNSMPVYYYVMEGPAEIKDGKLIFTKIPPRAKYPVKVTVVAWQYGRSVEPKVQTAEPVSKSFYIN